MRSDNNRGEKKSISSIHQKRWSLVTLNHIFRTRLARKNSLSLESISDRQWELAPGENLITPQAIYLPNQLERVTGWAFASDHPSVAMKGGVSISHGATRGFLLRDVFLIDGALYKDKAYSWLTPRARKWPTFHVDREIDRAALYCTASGNKYFGQWLMDDCVTYELAKNEGIPVTTDQRINIHTRGYEEWLEMQPERVNNVFFRELVIFDDYGQNRSKHQRFRDMSRKLMSRVAHQSHPGVFILRGSTGEKRLLQNELELAEYLHNKRGFRILEPEKYDVPSIMSICAGARTVIGVEGSGLMHGILALQKGGAVLALQPPDRFVRVYKDLTDRDGQYFGFVVGVPEGKSFRINPEEVERTLDLIPEISD